MRGFLIKSWLSVAIIISFLSACNTNETHHDGTVKNNKEIKVYFPTDAVISEFKSYRVTIANNTSALPLVGTLHTDKQGNKKIFLQDKNEKITNVITEKSGVFSSQQDRKEPIVISLIEPLEENDILYADDYVTEVSSSKLFKFSLDSKGLITATDGCGLQGRVEETAFHGVNTLNVISVNCEGSDIEGDIYFLHDSAIKPATYLLVFTDQARNIESSYVFKK